MEKQNEKRNKNRKMGKYRTRCTYLYSIREGSKFVSKQDDRRMLDHIRFTVNENKLEVISLDGYRAVRFTRKLAENKEEFTVFLRPECFIKGNFREVVLEKDKIIYRGGFFEELAIRLKEVDGKFPDMDKIYPDYINDYKGEAKFIGLNPNFMKDIASCTPDIRNAYIKFYMPNSQASPIVCTYESCGDLYEFLILPIRIIK